MGIGLAERPCDQRNNILISREHIGIFEIISSGLHHLPKQGAALRDGDGMFNLPEKFPPLLTVHVFHDNNEVVCIKAINLALKFDFREDRERDRR
ncbi:hypothetical protein ACH4P5_003141 [Vibrio mimicus]